MRAVYQPLAGRPRAVDATIRTEVDPDDGGRHQGPNRLGDRPLRSKQIDGPFGVRYTTGGDRMAWGNPVIGVRNPIAPPLVIQRDAVWGGVHRLPSWERPTKGRPVTCTGEYRRWCSITSLVRRQATGETPRFTGTITMRYLRTTKLGRLRAEARIDRTEV